MKVLIVDDEPDIITYLTTWFEDKGHQALRASDGRQGMQAIVDENPDLVLLDLKMPRQTGIQLYRNLRKTEKFRNLPVIFVTGMNMYQIFGEECESLPLPQASIDKPIDLTLLEEEINKIFN
jgi:CheY-like chemotaxis protein